MRWVVLTVLMACGQAPPPAFARLTEARHLVATLQTELAQSGEAANRALMQDVAARTEVIEARRAMQRDLAMLEPVVRGLSYEPEQALLTRLHAELERDRKLEVELLALTGEGSNLAAQQLSFGAAHAAVDRFHAAAPLAFEAAYALRSIEALEGPHIAEAEDAKMTALEQQMAAYEAQATRTAPPEAAAALHDFLRANERIVALSRRNTNVHALALASGDKRAAHVSCEQTLRELVARLGARSFPASR